ncbi:MAG TPA: DUF4491 family protein [Clostridiales bacterium]|nr:DUF4491 family protein [Clostridiales bacterium]
MYWTGIIIGAIAFLLIGLFHPVVIKCEYYCGSGIWPVFLIAGLICCAASLFVANILFGATLAILGFTLLWSVLELKHQAERVKKGWFPANPKRKK